jgi:GH25 family lysozyme M1 (1,4-beta-N-acetylmuramidase)
MDFIHNRKIKAVSCIMTVMIICFGIVGIMKADAEDYQADFSPSFVSGGFRHSDKYSSPDYKKLFIIDTSSYNTVTNWNDVYASGIYGVMLRIGYRGYRTASLNTDKNFEASYTAARNAGLKVGVYFYGQPVSVNDCRTEANYVLGVLNGRALDLPVAYDLEYAEKDGGLTGRFYEANLSRSELTDIHNTFGSIINSYGYNAMVYTNANMLTKKMNADSLAYPVWLARYNSYVDYDVNYTMWQFTSKGSINGANGNIDVSVMYVYDPLPQTEPSLSQDTPVIEPSYTNESEVTDAPVQPSTPVVEPVSENPVGSDSAPSGTFLTQMFAIAIKYLALIITLLGRLINFSA